MFKTLQEYFVHVMDLPFYALNPPPNGLATYGRTSSVIIHRSGQFQTELFIVPFDIERVEFHSHPNVDTYEMELTGQFDLKVRDTFIYARNDNNKQLRDRIFANIPNDAIHGGDIRKGASFLSFQHWLNDVVPTSVAIDYLLDLKNDALNNGKIGLDKKTLDYYKNLATKN